MNIQDRTHHAPRRTHSFDSYDNLDRLEQLRRRRNEFLANRTKFDPQPLVTAGAPPVPLRSSSRPVSPTSSLIQGFTDKLKEISSATDSSALPKRGTFQVLSLESPRKVTYKTTCHVFPTFKAPTADVENPKDLTNESTEEGTPLKRGYSAQRQRSFNSIDDLLSRLASRRNSFTAGNHSSNSVIKQTRIQSEMAKPFRVPTYEKRTDNISRAPENKPQRVPVEEAPCVKQHVRHDGYYSYATPFQDTVLVTDLSPERQQFEKFSLENSESIRESPIPFPRARNQVTPVITSSVPQSYPSYKRQQSNKGWRPVDAPFVRTSPAYSSLPTRERQADRSRYLESTLHQADLSPLSPSDRSNLSPIETTARIARRVSAGSATELKMRSKTSHIPVKDLIQKFSKE
ncbi:uncharacterized protein [Anabrus simplex]|uniref:uncharacterized protein n=1 Tax=Anabrus simplex TaxID=316456 RepID=UPI0035A2D247